MSIPSLYPAPLGRAAAVMRDRRHVGDRADRVVERRVDMRDTLCDVLLDLLARAGRGGLLQLLARRCASGTHVLCGLPCWHVEFDRRLARSLARARVGPRALAAYRESL